MDQTLKFKSQRAKPLNFHKKTPLLPKLTLWFMIFMYTFDFYGYHLPDAQVIWTLHDFSITMVTKIKKLQNQRELLSY